ncbi:MAG: DUF1343 domain-containing protein [Acidimicrobiales bacterium]|nr:DUF1343 domain-containing protein [Acidimicrobiales bacterium]
MKLLTVFITGAFLCLVLGGCSTTPEPSTGASPINPATGQTATTVIPTTASSTTAPPSSLPPTTAADTPASQAANLLTSLGRVGSDQPVRIGLVAHSASVIGIGRTIDVLNDADGIQLVRIFSPEHGLAGEADAGQAVADGTEPITGLPVISLYGVRRAPATRHLDDLDAVVYDLQDVGVRAFTYIATMGLVFDAAAAAGLPVFVVDRPNPQAGAVDGPVLDPGLESFISPYAIPLVYGLTSGQLGRLLVDDGYVDAGTNLTVVGPTAALGAPWRAPSPNLPTLESAWLYPAVVPLEATILSVGRGTTKPFSLIGAPTVDGRAMLDSLLTRDGLEVGLEAETFTPESIPGMAISPRYQGQAIVGVTLSTGAALRSPVRLAVELIDAAMDVSSDRSAIIDRPDVFDRLIGSSSVRAALIEDRSAAEIAASWTDEVNRFTERIERLRR